MSKKPVIKKIQLDPNGSPFLVTGSTTFSEEFNLTQDGIKPTGLHAKFSQDVAFDSNPHVCPLDIDTQPKVKLGGEEDYVLFIRKNGKRIEFKLFIESDDPTSDNSTPVYEAEIAATKMMEITVAIARKTKPQMQQIMASAAGSMNDRKFQIFAKKVLDEADKMKSKVIMKALSGAITFNRDFLKVIANTIEAITMYENKGLIEEPGKRVSVAFGGSQPKN